MKHERKPFDHLSIDVEGVIRASHPQFYATYCSYVFFSAGWTHPQVEEAQKNAYDNHEMWLPNMSKGRVIAALAQCTPCNCKRCVKALLEK